MRVQEKALSKIVKKYFKNIDNEYIKELARLINMYPNLFVGDDSIAIFLANLLAEIEVKKSGKVRTRENMNYSWEGLLQTFPNEFTKKTAQKYGRCCNHKADKVEIANIAYANRLGNGNRASGQGYEYRGLGGFQITGADGFKKMYEAMNRIFGINLNFLKDHPKLVDKVFNTYTMNILSAMAYWYYSGMKDAYTIDDAIDIINKNTKSRAKRKRMYKYIKEQLRKV